MSKMDDLTGLWTRSLIAWPDGRRDDSTRVHWLQAQSLFADLRQPAFLARISSRCLDELTMADCLSLATQQGFAGVFGQRDIGFEWVRKIDLQPDHGVPDAGRLTWHGDVLVEDGLAGDYTEHWHRAAEARRPCAAFALHDRDYGRHGSLIRVGDHFMYARGRSGVATGADLVAAVAGAVCLPAARALLDLEISFGLITGDEWRIAHSTLPYRVGAALHRQPQGSGGLAISEPDRAGGTTIRAWTIVAAEGEDAALLARETCS